MVQLLSCVDSKFTFLAVSIYDRNMFYSIVYRSSEKTEKMHVMVLINQPKAKKNYLYCVCFEKVMCVIYKKIVNTKMYTK